MEKSHYYVIPDIHGEYNLLKTALQKIYYDNPDGGKIIFLGDYIDRGPNSKIVVDIVRNPPANWQFICLRGNHEDMLYNCFNSYHYTVYDTNVLEQYNQPYTKNFSSVLVDFPPSQEMQDLLDWIETLKYFHIEDSNVFSHAFYDSSLSEDKQNLDLVMWQRMNDFEPFRPSETIKFLTHGHTPRKHGPVSSPNRLNLDCGAVYYGRLVVAKFEKNVVGPREFMEIVY
jgi:serine/threonine protein phosphatase 1